VKGRAVASGEARSIGGWRLVRVFYLVAAPAMLGMMTSGCGSSGPPSPAADGYIARAADEEEHAGLTQARDDIDDEMRGKVEERQDEIARLRRENEELKAKLAARQKTRSESGSKN
jgi:hypothetical protein